MPGLLIAQIAGITLTEAEITMEAIATMVSVIPFIVILIGGGSWLVRSNLPSDRYRRIAGWLIAGFSFLTVVFTVIAFATEESWLVRAGIIHWAVSVGSGTGLLIGIFESRAVENALKAEHARIRTEELRKQNERLDNIASSISHDLRNPLTVAEGNLKLLQEDYDDDRLRTISEMLDRMNQTIEDTLTLARDGQVITDPEEVTLREIADQSWRAVNTKQASLEIREERTITADSDRVQRLLENLFRNAIEHGKDDVTVRIGPLGDGFYIEDNGPGISEEDQDCVFNTGYTTNNGGTGFGLAITKQISNAHNWEISVTEGTDGGARFEVTGVEFAN